MSKSYEQSPKKVKKSRSLDNISKPKVKKNSRNKSEKANGAVKLIQYNNMAPIDEANYPNHPNANKQSNEDIRKNLLKQMEETMEMIKSDKFVVVDNSFEKHIINIKKKAEQICKIDQKLVRNVIKLLGPGNYVEKEDYADLEKELSDTDLVLYFQDADVIGRVLKNNRDPIMTQLKKQEMTRLQKIEDKDEESVDINEDSDEEFHEDSPKKCEFLDMCINFALRGEDYNNCKDVYEVVRNDQPQKIVIISSGKISDKSNLIQRYIRAYMKSKKIEIEKRDIKCLKNKQTGHNEVFITKYFVNNSSEKDAFISGLRDYIKRKKGDESIIKYLGRKEPPALGIPSTAPVLLPYQKEYADGQAINYQTTNGMDDLIVSAIKECLPLNMNLTTPITVNIAGNLNINSNNTQNNISQKGNNNIANITNNPYKLLYSQIVKNRPEWYVTNKYLDKKNVYKKLSEMLNCTTTEKLLWSSMKKKIIAEEKRIQKNNKRGTFIKLKNLWQQPE